jgi:hypothetical protein
MTDQENKPEKMSRQKRESIVITDAAAQRLDRYIEQINAQKPLNLSRKAFLSWFLESGSENLSNKQVSAAIERFYNTKTHLRQLLRKVTEAEANGQDGEFEIVFRPKKIESKKEMVTEDLDDSADLS